MHSPPLTPKPPTRIRNPSRSAPRSRTGCLTCRHKKVKCDETHPICHRCTRLNLPCAFLPTSSTPSSSSSSSSSSLSSSSGTSSLVRARRTSSASRRSSGSEESGAGSRAKGQRRARQLLFLAYLKGPLLPVLEWAGPAGCGVVMEGGDWEAMKFFQTALAAQWQTKRAKFSLFRIISVKARDDPLLMSMLLALGWRSLEWARGPVVESGSGSGSGSGSDSSEEEEYGSEESEVSLFSEMHTPESTDCSSPRDTSRSLPHLGTALSLLQQLFSSPTTPNIDNLLAALYLLLIYEYSHGHSPQIPTLKQQLIGTAQLIELYLPPLLSPLSRPLSASTTTSSPIAESSSILSQFSARILTRMCSMDSAAASFGTGGHMTSSLHKIMRNIDPNATAGPMGLVENFARLDGYAVGLYRRYWNDGYPSVELVDDLENRAVYDFLCAACQLRYVVARLGDVLRAERTQYAASSPSVGIPGNPGLESQLRAVAEAIDDVGGKYKDIIEVAERLEADIGHERRLVANIRWIVPYFYAVQLDFLRVLTLRTEFIRRTTTTRLPISCDPAAPNGVELNVAQRDCLQRIMALAWQGYVHEGDAAVSRMGYPLFMVALETDDEIHREWIRERFRGLEKLGRNWRIAGELMGVVVEKQRGGRRVDLLMYVREQTKYQGFCL